MVAKRILAGTVASLFVLGCGSSPNASPDASTGQGDQTGSGKPGAALPTQPAPAAPLNNAGTDEQIKHDKEEQGKTGSSAAYYPNRVYQLKDLKIADLRAAGKTIHAWIMDTPEKRNEGMMFLVDKDVKDDQGMIFLFSAMQKGAENSFWMHNCPMGLDIIYIGKDKRILNVGDGVPENDNPVAAKGNYFYVLELKRGWSKAHHLVAGDEITIPATLKTDS